MIPAVTPIAERHVIVDPDKVDLGIGPQGIKVKEHVTRPVHRMIAEVLRPIGGIADLHIRPQDCAHLACQGAQGINRRKAVRTAPHLGQRSHLGPDAKRVNAPCQRAKMRVMQDKPAIAEPIRAGVCHPIRANRKLRRRGRAKESRNLCLGRRCAIR